MTVTVVASDERTVADIATEQVDVGRFALLAERAAVELGGNGELTLTFVDRDDIAELNSEFMGQDGPTDVLSFPMDDEPMAGVPTLLGDVVVCPSVAAEQFADHAGSFDDELALLVVHGVLHVFGHDHAEPGETVAMRSAELRLLSRYHWRGPAPIGFRQAHD